MKGKNNMNKTFVLINKLDIKYREIENFDNQLDVFNFMCGFMTDKQLKDCLRYAKSKQKQDKLERGI
tara:strand:+ start:208 stop:408 length:201 start_codon:yes stop_codon:yes gene_type:complete